MSIDQCMCLCSDLKFNQINLYTLYIYIWSNTLILYIYVYLYYIHPIISSIIPAFLIIPGIQSCCTDLLSVARRVFFGTGTCATFGGGHPGPCFHGKSPFWVGVFIGTSSICTSYLWDFWVRSFQWFTFGDISLIILDTVLYGNMM